MAKRLNMFILVMLIVSQTILGPLVSTSAVLAEGSEQPDGQKVNDEGETGEVIDDEKLLKLLKDVEKYKEENYEADSFKTFLEAVTAGEEVADDTEVTKENVNDAVDEIKEAIAGLQRKDSDPKEEPEKKEEKVKRADKTALKALLGKVNELEEDGFTEDSFDTLMNVTNTAKEVLENEDATQDEVDKAVNTVKEARDGLEHSIATLNDNEEPKEITENIIDEIILQREDGSLYKAGEQLDLNEDLELGLEWSLPNDPMYVGGDTFTFQLPEQLAIYSEITGDLDDYGTFVVTTDGEVTFTFNDKINKNSNVKGTFWVKTELDKQKITKSTEELEIVFNEDVAKKVTINVKPEKGQAIHKEGQPVDGTFNTEEIKWTVLINTTKDALENAIVTDPILNGQELILDSLDLKEIEVNLAGEKVDEIGPVDLTDIDQSTTEELKLELGDTNKAYKLTFKTKIKEEEKNKEGWEDYANTAYLNSDGKDKKESGASVSVNRPKSMEKTSSAFNKKDRSIEWTVNANFNERNLAKGEEITDEFTFTVDGNDFNEVFEIDVNDITIEQVDEFSSDGTVKTKSDAKDLFDISVNGNKVTYTLEEETNKAFIINYKTKAKDGAIINKNGTIANKVDLNGKTDDSSQGVVQQVGKKTSASIDYNKKEITWEITINADKQDLQNFILTDDFSGSGQKLKEKSVKIAPEKANAEITPAADRESFTIDFGNIQDTYVITYTTEYVYDFKGEKAPIFTNGVDVTYETSDGGEYELKFGDQVTPNNETKNNGVKNGTANTETKEITWTIDVNYNNLTLTDARIIDEIADNQSLVDGSVKVYETSIDSDGNITKDDDDVTENFDVTAEKNLVKVLFGEIEQSHRVEFKTKDKDGIYNSDEVYENTAQFIPREGEKHNLKSSVTLPNQGEFLGKTGLHNKEDWTVDWTIDVNKSQSTLTDVTVKDDLGEDGSQILLEDSIKVVKEGSDEAVSEDVYKLTVDGNKFTVTFPGEITDAYQVMYSSYILAGETADIKNEAEIASIEEEILGSVKKEEEVEVKISTGGGTAEGATGGLTLEKTEKDTERPLENVKFTLLTTIGDQEIVVREDTTDEEGKLEWTGLKYGEYMLIEEIPEGYTGVESQEVTIDNDSLEDGVLTLKDDIVNERQTGKAKIIKIDAATDEELPGAKFEITNETTGQKYTLTTEDDGTITEEVPFGQYTVEEVEAPNGYRTNEDIDNITIEIDELTEVTIKNEAFVNVEGEKTWITSEDEEDLNSITVKLLANEGEVDSKEVSASDEWKYSFTDLDKYDEAGEEIDYAIAEVEVDGYESKTDGYDLTNIQLIDLSGTKIWDEVDSQHRPNSITVNLLANEEEVASETVTGEADENEWSFLFTDLPKYGTDGEKIEYTFEEGSHKGYSSEVDPESYEITNTQKTTEIPVEKMWQDDDDATKDRPESITLQVKSGDTVVKEQEVTADEDWNYTFTDLPKYDQEGNEITYTVDEKDVPEGYAKSVDGNEVTNTRTGTTEVDITKHWEDEHETDRPDEITVNLLQNGTFFEEHTVTKDNDWKLNISDLPAFDEEGKAYAYSVKEHDVAGYEVEIKGFEITNTRTDAKDIEITKAWIDTEETADRPDEIEIELFRSVIDGENESVETYEVNAAEDWKLEIKNLPSFNEKGKAYAYEIKEKAVEGYEADINGFDITNLRVGETDVSGEKIWDEVDDRYRPDSITIQLLANGEEEDTIEVSDETDWSYGFTGLDKYDDQGKEIVYTIEEPEVPTGYDSDVDGYNITNTQKVTDVSGTKTWLDDDSESRPSSITVQLLINEEEIDSLKITSEDDWKYEFINLPKYDKEGEKISYTIKEKTVPEGYKESVDDEFNITNLRVGVTSVEVTKDWVDEGRTDRPESITVNLLQNGKVIETEDVTAEDNWSYTFENLDKYDKEGIAYEYTITEHDVAGYEVDVDGFDLTNTRTEDKAITINKAWSDDDNQSEKRPDKIEVDLYRSIENADAEKVDTYDVTAKNDWSLTIDQLPAFDDNGKGYTYEIKEKPVTGYETKIDGFDITNTLIEEPVKLENPKQDEEEDTDKGALGGLLPKTATNTFNLLLAGALLLVAGTGFTIFRRRKTE